MTRQQSQQSTRTGVFTRFVSAVDVGEDGAGLLEELWQELRTNLHRELVRRGLIGLPPRCLGVFGGASWLDPTEHGQSPGRPGGRDALDELTVDCFVFVFVQRLRALRGHLKVKDNVDGLVLLNIRHFLLERQRDHDPVGYRVYHVLRSAVQAAVEAGDLQVVDGDPRIRNDTVLRPRHSGPVSPRQAPELKAVVLRWNDDLLPELIAAQGKRQRAVVVDLSKRLGRLAEEGFGDVCFKDLVSPLKADARARWSEIRLQAEGETVLEHGDEAFRSVVRLVYPETSFEERAWFDRLVSEVDKLVADHPGTPATRRHLRSLWRFLKAHAQGEEEGTVGSAAPDALPPRRAIASLLGVPRSRLPELYQIIGAMLTQVRETTPGNDGVITHIRERAPRTLTPRSS